MQIISSAWQLLRKNIFHSNREWFTQIPHSKKPQSFDWGSLLYLKPGSLRWASCPAPFGPTLRVVQNRSRRFCPTLSRRLPTKFTQNKKAILSDGLFVLIKAWQFPTLAWGDPTLPSALRRFTSEFGMGSGGTTALRPPGKFCFIRPLLRSDLICIRLKIFSHPPKQLRRCKVKPHGSLVPVSSTHRCAYTPGLSTSSSSTFLQDP